MGEKGGKKKKEEVGIKAGACRDGWMGAMMMMFWCICMLYMLYHVYITGVLYGSSISTGSTGNKLEYFSTEVVTRTKYSV